MSEFADVDELVALGLSAHATCSVCGIDGVKTISVMVVGLRWLKQYANLERWKHVSRVYLRHDGNTLWPCCTDCMYVMDWKRSSITVEQAEKSFNKLVRGVDFP